MGFCPSVWFDILLHKETDLHAALAYSHGELIQNHWSGSIRFFGVADDNLGIAAVPFRFWYLKIRHHWLFSLIIIFFWKVNSSWIWQCKIVKGLDYLKLKCSVIRRRWCSMLMTICGLALSHWRLQTGWRPMRSRRNFEPSNYCNWKYKLAYFTVLQALKLLWGTKSKIVIMWRNNAG